MTDIYPGARVRVTEFEAPFYGSEGEALQTVTIRRFAPVERVQVALDGRERPVLLRPEHLEVID